MNKKWPVPAQVINTQLRIFYRLDDGTVWENTGGHNVELAQTEARNRMAQEPRIVEACVAVVHTQVYNVHPVSRA